MFVVEPILLLPNLQVGEKQPNENEEAKGARQMSIDFYAGFGPCLIDKCFLNCMRLETSENFGGSRPSWVVVIWNKLSLG